MSAERPAATGAELIAAERQRQIDAEGWTPQHAETLLSIEGLTPAQAEAVEALLAGVRSVSGNAANRPEFLLVLALKVDATRLEPTVKATLGAAVDPLVRYTDSEAHVYAKQVDDLVAADLDALAALIGWDAVQRLRVGDVVAVDFHYPFGDAATRGGSGVGCHQRPKARA